MNLPRPAVTQRQLQRHLADGLSMTANAQRVVSQIWSNGLLSCPPGRPDRSPRMKRLRATLWHISTIGGHMICGTERAHQLDAAHGKRDVDREGEIGEMWTWCAGTNNLRVMMYAAAQPGRRRTMIRVSRDRPLGAQSPDAGTTLISIVVGYFCGL